MTNTRSLPKFMPALNEAISEVSASNSTETTTNGTGAPELLTEYLFLATAVDIPSTFGVQPRETSTSNGSSNGLSLSLPVFKSKSYDYHDDKRKAPSGADLQPSTVANSVSSSSGREDLSLDPRFMSGLAFPASNTLPGTLKIEIEEGIIMEPGSIWFIGLAADVALPGASIAIGSGDMEVEERSLTMEPMLAGSVSVDNEDIVLPQATNASTQVGALESPFMEVALGAASVIFNNKADDVGMELQEEYHASVDGPASSYTAVVSVETSFSELDDYEPSPDDSLTSEESEKSGVLEPQAQLSSLPDLPRAFPGDYPADLIAIEKIDGKGHGIVAICDIPAGTRILSEKVLMNTLPFSVTTQQLGLQENEVYVTEQFNNLELPYQTALCALRPGRDLGTAFWRSDIVLSNGFEVMIAPDISVVKLFRNTSLYNHSCNPNTYWHFDYDKKEIVTQTIKPIRCGEELTICYVEDGLPFPERQDRLRRFYGFTCICPHCMGTTDELAKKDNLVAQLKELQSYTGYVSLYSVSTHKDILAERQKYYNIVQWIIELEIEGQMPMHQIFIGARRLFSRDSERQAVLGFLAWEVINRYMGSDSDEMVFLAQQIPTLPVHYWVSQELGRYWMEVTAAERASVYEWIFEDLPGQVPRVGPFAVMYRRANLQW